MKELTEIVAARKALPEVAFALATVVGVTGSSYRRPGARMLVDNGGRVAGSVSGGCLEEDVIRRAREVMASGDSQVAVYDTRDDLDRIFGSGMGCRGKIEILIERLAPAARWPLADSVARVVARREPEELSTPVQVVAESEAVVEFDSQSPDTFPYRRVIRTAQGLVDMFIERISPAPALVVFGAGPDAVPLVRMARELGMFITVVERRPAVRREAFPEADVFLCQRPTEAVKSIQPQDGDAVVIMNHNYETDRDSLAAVLPLAGSYLGMLGPRQRTDHILDDLAKSGVPLPACGLERLHAPAGLDLGSNSPEQIALSILAEIQASIAGRSAAKLRSRLAPINSPSI